MTDVLTRIGLRRMTSRNPSEPHRVATPLELLFDLVFVVAVAQASQNLHHLISDDHVGQGVLSYLMVFFAIWWAWMNFTWFASAFDTDDWLYRVHDDRADGRRTRARRRRPRGHGRLRLPRS